MPTPNPTPSAGPVAQHAAEASIRAQMRATPAGKLLLRAGFEPYDTESSARRVAECAAKEHADLVAALERIQSGAAHFSAVISEGNNILDSVSDGGVR